MPKNVETKQKNRKLFQDAFQLPSPSLRSYFKGVERGSSKEYRTKFYPRKKVQEILNEWLNHLEKIQKEWPTLWKFEIDLSQKVGPLSIRKPLKERMEDIDSYYRLISPGGEPISKAAQTQMLKEWAQVRGLRRRSINATVENMKKSTNSGAPYFTKRKDVTTKTVPFELIPGSFKGEEVYTQVLPTGEYACVAILGWRGQEGGPNSDDVKQRVVWMFPYAVNIAELTLYQPLISAVQRANLVPAWVSLDAVDAAVTRLFDTKADRDLIVCTDFEKFDQHFNQSCQDCAHDVLRALSTNSVDNESWFNTVFPIKYTIPLAYNYYSVAIGKHGMASGSGGTNADETIVHRVLQHEAAMMNRSILNPNSQCLGDDGLLSYPGITVKDVVRCYTAHGLEMNDVKQYFSTDDCIYLRRWHHKNYRVKGIAVGVYSTCRAIGRLAEQERYYGKGTWSKEMVALRQLSILQNCEYHPLREEFVDFCMKGDRYRLGLDIPGFLDRISEIAQKAIDYMPDFLGYSKTLGDSNPSKGIADWWIVQYLKSKA